MTVAERTVVKRMVARKENEQNHPQAPNIALSRVLNLLVPSFYHFRRQVGRSAAIGLERRILIHQLGQTKVGYLLI